MFTQKIKTLAIFIIIDNEVLIKASITADRQRNNSQLSKKLTAFNMHLVSYRKRVSPVESQGR